MKVANKKPFIFQMDMLHCCLKKRKYGKASELAPPHEPR
jgi:hypothetical protein